MRFRVAALLLALLAACVGCGGRDVAAPSAASPAATVPAPAAPLARETTPPTTLKLGIVTTGLSNQLPLAVAEQLGYFRDEGCWSR